MLKVENCHFIMTPTDQKNYLHLPMVVIKNTPHGHVKGEIGFCYNKSNFNITKKIWQPMHLHIIRKLAAGEDRRPTSVIEIYPKISDVKMFSDLANGDYKVIASTDNEFYNLIHLLNVAVLQPLMTKQICSTLSKSKQFGNFSIGINKHNFVTRLNAELTSLPYNEAKINSAMKLKRMFQEQLDFYNSNCKVNDKLTLEEIIKQ